ncbi:MAG TPA: twin-arginine translocation signal domain-containing protein, partial [Sedimentisphaerales bacterium]|nr:twin-arginine translocation signal domain-containing protein [Sedimentisphaerales bacterium]
MNTSNRAKPTSRREFLKLSGRMAASAALVAGIGPRMHAAEGGPIKLALVGCGGRGTGAVADAFTATGGPVKLYAMADLNK